MYQGTNNNFYPSGYSSASGGTRLNTSPMPSSPQQPYGNGWLKGRQVSSLEEVRAIPIDFDGSVFYFPDIVNGRIYTKQIGMDGNCIYNMYELKEIPAANQPVDQSKFVTRDEFDKLVEQLKSSFGALNQQVNAVATQSIQPQPQSNDTILQF